MPLPLFFVLSLLLLSLIQFHSLPSLFSHLPSLHPSSPSPRSPSPPTFITLLYYSDPSCSILTSYPNTTIPSSPLLLNAPPEYSHLSTGEHSNPLGGCMNTTSLPSTFLPPSIQSVRGFCSAWCVREAIFSGGFSFSQDEQCGVGSEIGVYADSVVLQSCYSVVGDKQLKGVGSIMVQCGGEAC